MNAIKFAAVSILRVSIACPIRVASARAASISGVLPSTRPAGEQKTARKNPAPAKKSSPKIAGTYNIFPLKFSLDGEALVIER
ncbi:MAG: hypothetical protein K2H64_10185 [Desulfovibrio sp.]|nr:hypothetical protein [Desulfovibrio sp.]